MIRKRFALQNKKDSLTLQMLLVISSDFIYTFPSSNARFNDNDCFKEFLEISSTRRRRRLTMKKNTASFHHTFSFESKSRLVIGSFVRSTSQLLCLALVKISAIISVVLPSFWLNVFVHTRLNTNLSSQK